MLLKKHDDKAWFFRLFSGYAGSTLAPRTPQLADSTWPVEIKSTLGAGTQIILTIPIYVEEQKM